MDLPITALCITAPCSLAAALVLYLAVKAIATAPTQSARYEAAAAVSLCVGVGAVLLTLYYTLWWAACAL